MSTIGERLERVIRREAPTWGVEPTTDEVRRLSGLDFAVLWGDLGIGLLVLVTGALLVPALGLPTALLAIVVGSILGCLPLAFVGRAGAREGLPGMVLLRPVLGTRGSYLPSVLNVLQLVGWTAFELWAMALVASRVAAPLGAGSFYLWLAVAAILCLLLSLGGPVVVVRRWMERFGVWILGGVAVWVTVRLLTSVDLAAMWSAPGKGGFPTFGPAVDLVVAMPISWVPLVADYSRFARRGVSSAGGTYTGYLIANIWLYSLGALLVLGAGAAPSPAGIGDAIAALAGGALVLVVLLVGETDEAFADIYSAAVSAQNLVPRLRQRTGVIAVSAIGVAVAVWLFGQPEQGVLAFESFLLLIGSIFVPLFGVFLADYFVLGRARGYDRAALFDPEGPYRFAAGFNPLAVAAWVMGFVVYQWILPTGPDPWVAAVGRVLPPLSLGGVVPASVVSFAIAFASYAAIGRIAGRPSVTR